MTIIDRYLASRVIATLAKALVSLVFLYVLIDLLTHERSAIMKYDVPASIVVQYYLAMVPQIAYRVAPLAMLVSALFVLGRAAQDNEILAGLAGGISLWRLARLPILVALVFALVLFGVEETVGASAVRKVEELDNKYFSKSSGNNRAGVSWANLEGDWTCHVAKFNRIALTGEQVFMHSIRDDGIHQIYARRMFWEPDDSRGGAWIIEDGLWSETAPDYSRRKERITQRAAPIVEPPEVLFALEESADTKTAAQLAREIRNAESRRMPVQRYWVDFHAKFAQPAVCFVMIWLAIPFAMRLGRGGIAISFGSSIAIAIAYLIIFGVGMGLGHMERIPPFLAAWLANAVFLAAGITLFVRTPT